ncbi:MAG TPA: ankyrin repeat domain-containing protein [Gammaproteobacteria bacterium]|jgi:ankyrin repeat protein|nr:ankyrin repeat domain-containing protein [Gammaproteobacteria bacterium]
MVRGALLVTVAGAVLVALLLGIGVGAAPKGEDVNRRNADGSTPLQWAVYEGNATEVRRLIAAGADVSLANEYGATPMGLAAEVADTEILKMLLAAGANADSPNAEGQTALMAVARTGNVQAAQLLIERGATVDGRERWGGQSALMWASARRHPQMMDLLIAHGAEVDARSIDRDYQRHVTAEGRPKNLDSGGFTPLLYAARENCLACVDVLLKHGADINLPDPDGVTPLHLAIINNNWDLAKKLIEAGADVDQWDIYGEAPLFAAIGHYTRRDGPRASIDPPNATDGKDVIRLLLDRGANPNMQLFFRPAGVNGSTNTRGSTPLIRAANVGDLELVKLLLDRGADAKLYMADRQTPIHAVLAGRVGEKQALEIIRVLHEAGTDVNVVALVNHREEVRGGSALHFAVRKRYKEVIKQLASFGIDMNLKDQDGLTALDYTQSRGFMPFMALQTPLYKEEAALLRELGATVLLRKDPVWPVLGPPQGVWVDIWPLGEPVVHEPVYKHSPLE